MNLPAMTKTYDARRVLDLPALTLKSGEITAVIGGRELYEDPARREAFADRYDLRTHVLPGDAPAFLCACADDFVVPPPFLVKLQQSYVKAGVSCELHLFPYGGHGFGACIPRQVGPFAPPDMTACRQWRELFCTWVNGVFDGKLNG